MIVEKLIMSDLTTDQETIHPYLEDSAHFPGGHAPGLYRPQTEQEIVSLLKQHHASGQPLIVQGARTSLTGGATPLGETIISLENLNQILRLEKDGEGYGSALMQPFVRLKNLNEAAEKMGLYYPPTPTYDLATIGGTVATCAAGSATFKYGTTRDWVISLRILLANGESLTVRRGDCFVNSTGLFKTETDSGQTLQIPMPRSYTTPMNLKKVSCGYMAHPKLDLIDFFIGSEGTLGIVTEIEVKLIPLPTAVLSGLSFFDSEQDAFECVKGLRESHQIDARAMEFLDQKSLEILRENKIDQKIKVPIPINRKAAIYFEIELKEMWETDKALELLESMLNDDQGQQGKQALHDIEALFQLLQQFKSLNPDELILAFPKDQTLFSNLKEIREAVPTLINEIISRAQAQDSSVTKIAADVIAPFERIPEMIQAFRKAADQAMLPVILFGHISDGNLHPNILVKNSHEIARGKECLRQAMKQVLALGGAPMAEHGVGRNPLKQEFLSSFYGEKGVQEMAQAKLTLDPRGILSPGVIFSKELLNNTGPSSNLKIGATIKNVGDEQGELWQFSLKSLTKTQDFVNGFLARFLKNNAKAQTLAKEVQQIGHKTSGYMTDYIAIPFSLERIRELKKRGFVHDKTEIKETLFRHMEGIFPPFILRPTLLEPITKEILEEHVPIEYEYDEEDIWVPLENVWAHLPTVEDNYSELAQKEFPFISSKEIPEIEVGWRVGSLNKFNIKKEQVQGGPLYRKAYIPKQKKQESQLCLVEREIGIYNGFDTSSKAPQRSFLLKVTYSLLKGIYSLFNELFVFLFGTERLIAGLKLFLGAKWTRHLLNEVHDAEWIRNCPKGKKDKETVETLLGKRAWNIFVDHRTLRRSLLPHLSLFDRLLKLIFLKSKKSMGQNEVCYRVLQQLELEKHEDYVPSSDSDWKARVLRDRNRSQRKLRSQLAYFLDESLPKRRGNIATYAAFWGASTGWNGFDLLLAFFRIGWGPDPWFFHHIAIEGNFEKLAKATGEDYVSPEKGIKNAKEVGFLDRFSFMWFLRQVFSQEVRSVSKRRLQALYLAGRLTKREFEKYKSTLEKGQTKVEGPHLEIIDRRSGIPWFNQVRVTQAIQSSSEIKIEVVKGLNEDLIEPWRQRAQTSFHFCWK